MKLKTHRGLAKRIKKTKTGKIKRRSAFISHLLSKKSAARKRRHAVSQDVSMADRKVVRKLVPYNK
ncbi:MAG TPA: 50S ribosomal protein L35 [Patescibacteria group bacterium]|nr:50S ribosomal protein L35 [Patescibacteria group bacterium]